MVSLAPFFVPKWYTKINKWFVVFLILFLSQHKMKAILGQKKNMGQTFVGGTRIPVTYIQAGPCVVTQIKNNDKDGYWAVQVGYGTKRTKNISKPVKGHLKAAYKNDNEAARFLREIRVDKEPDFKVGDTIQLTDVIKKGDSISVTGVSKGKGFAGVVKRWNFGGGPRTHGQSDRLRAPGSIGQGTDPGRVRKGKKMAGRMGTQMTYVKNLIVVDVDKENNIIAVSGPVPGHRGSLLFLQKLESGKLEDLIEEAPEITEQEIPDEEQTGEKQEAQEEVKEEGKDE